MEEVKPVTTGRVRRVSFWIAAGVTGAFLLVALLAAYPLLFTNWLPTDAWLAVRPDRSPGDQVHRLHSLALSVISWGALSGVALQFHRAWRKLGALLMSLAAVLAVACGLGITGTLDIAGMAPFLLLPLLTLALHPSARTITHLRQVDLPMLPLAVFAALTWVTYALNIAEAARVAGPDGDAEHLTFMVIVALAIPLWALLGTTKIPGWVFPASAAIVASACVGLQSLIFSDALSGLGPVWASAALAWCIAFGSAAWLRARLAPKTWKPLTEGGA